MPHRTAQILAALPSRSTLFRWLRRAVYTLLLLAFLLVLGYAGFLAWVRQAMRVSLPQIDGTISLGVSAPVTVLRDHHGVPHIRAQSLDDLFYAQGYVTAQDRLWQMDILRRHGSGELAEIFGSSALSHDRMQRYLQLRHTADAAAASLSADDRRYLDDYARGVNAFIDSHTGEKPSGPLPAEFRVLHYSPTHWQPRDTLLIALIMDQDLTTGYPAKLGRERVMAKLPPALSGDLYPVGSWRDHPPAQPVTDLTQPQQDIPDIPLDETQSKLAPPTLSPSADAEYIAALRTLRTDGSQFCDSCRNGSNEWVVSGAHTASGHPLLSNDMHLQHLIPEIWYIADLAAPGFHAAGVTIPGAPYVVVGHNDHIAWGFTNLGADVQDLYIEQINSQDQSAITSSDGKISWQPIEHRREVIHVRGHADVSLDVRVTAHGPIISPLLPHESRAISLRWTIYDSAAVKDPFLDIDTAQNWQQFCTAFSHYGSPAQNAVYADTAGNIGYHAVGWVPNRPNGLNATPIAGGQGEWQGYIPFDQMPSVYNPAEGVLATANSRVTPDDDANPLTLNWEAPYRNERIWKSLLGRTGMHREDMLALQNNVDSTLDHELAQRFAYAIDHTANASTRLRQAADLLRNWNGAVTTDAVAPTILAAARNAFWPMLLQPRLGNDWQAYQWAEHDYVQEELIVHQPARWLPPGYATWDALLTAAVERGLRAEHAPHNLNNWHWGDAHPAEVRHALYSLLPFMSSLTSTGVHPQSGNIDTIKSVRRDFGPSERFTADLANLDDSTLNIVVGESGNPMSPWYRDQWPIWYGGTTFSLPFTDAAVNAAAEHTLVLQPSVH